MDPPVLNDGDSLGGKSADLRIGRINKRKLLGANESVKEGNKFVGTLR